MAASVGATDRCNRDPSATDTDDDAGLLLLLLLLEDDDAKQWTNHQPPYHAADIRGAMLPHYCTILLRR